MRTISDIILTTVLGWKINGEFPDIEKSVVIFAPHTSFWDAIVGKLYLLDTGVRHRFLSKKELFKFPLNIVMYSYGSIPVSSDRNFILHISEVFKSNKNIHVVLSPEGTRRKVTNWKKGFYHIAKRANVPIVVGYIDFKKKEIGIKGVINNNNDINETMNEIGRMYKNVSAKYPADFILDEKSKSIK